MPKDKSIPAWLMCEDLFNRIKTELITQAMETLQEAIDSKSIEINGSLVNLPDRPSDTEMHMFIISRLIAEKESIIERYKNHLSGGDDNPKGVQQKERLRKFLLAVEQISTLMQYSRVFDDWMHDIAMQITVKEPSQVIANTIKKEGSRISVLDYVVKNRKMEHEKILTKGELDMLKECIRNA